MREIKDERIKKVKGAYEARCVSCEKVLSFSAKNSAVRMLNRKTCRNCKRDYRALNNEEINIYQNDDQKWCSVCSGCGKEQAYTRKDHAKQSSHADWQCRKCVQQAKGFSENLPVGNEKRVYNKFKKAAFSRNLDFNLTQEEFYKDFNGVCSLTGWKIDLSYSNPTASVDRIDNDKGYIKGNIQWVHVSVNMSRGKKDLKDFIKMCEAVAKYKIS